MSIWTRWLRGLSFSPDKGSRTSKRPARRQSYKPSFEHLEDCVVPANSSTFSFASAAYSIGESGGTQTITVNRTITGTGNNADTVNYAVTAGTATAGVDYTSPASGTLSFANNATSATFTISIVNDNLVESNETINLSLSKVNSADSIGTGTATVTITDNDIASLSINDISVNEGNSGTTNFNFTVTLSNPSPNTITADWTRANVGTTNGDFGAGSPTTGSLSFAPGETTKTISIPVKGETNVEPNETFTVTLSNAVNATISDNQGVGTIVNDDNNSPPVAVSDTYSVSEDAVLSVAASSGVLLNDSDPNGDAISAVVVTGPSHGGLSLAADGSFTYTITDSGAPPLTATIEGATA